MSNDLREVDKWCAEQCGIKITTNNGYIDQETKGLSFQDKWTIADPRCREIVRERFGIDTNQCGDLWEAQTGGGITNKPFIAKQRKSIAEAEIACITEIWEARDGNTKD